jgi:hypothetical protein
VGSVGLPASEQPTCLATLPSGRTFDFSEFDLSAPSRFYSDPSGVFVTEISRTESDAILRGAENISTGGNVFLEVALFVCRGCVAICRPLRFQRVPQG